MTRQEFRDFRLSKLSKMEVGDEENSFRQLSGMFAEEFSAIGKNHPLCQQVLATVHHSFLFSPPDEQIRQLLETNEEVWKNPEITAAKIKEIGDPPVCPSPIFNREYRRFYVLVLYYEFQDAKNHGSAAKIGTFWKYWEALEHFYGAENVLYGDDKFDPKTREVTRADRTPLVYDSGVRDHFWQGMQWLLVELGYRFPSQSDPDKLRMQLRTSGHRGLAHQVLSLALMHPRWFCAMDSVDYYSFGINPVVALDLNIISTDGHPKAPQLRCRNGKLIFSSSKTDNDLPGPHIVKEINRGTNKQSRSIVL